MKKILLFFLPLFFLMQACDIESGPDCFKKKGDVVTEIIEVSPFSKISISEGIELTVKQADTQSVEIKVGKNLIRGIELEVKDGELIIENLNNCQILRNYHPVKIYVSTPNLERIYSSSQYNIYSDGILRFPDLSLESGITDDTASGIWEMQIENQKLKIQDNVSAVYRIKGKTENLQIWFWGQNGRFEGAELKADWMSFYHRSTNDIIVFPIYKISGTLMSTGNVVLKNVPPEIDVEQFLTGHLVYP